MRHGVLALAAALLAAAPIAAQPVTLGPVSSLEAEAGPGFNVAAGSGFHGGVAAVWQRLEGAVVARVLSTAPAAGEIHVLFTPSPIEWVVSPAVTGLSSGRYAAVWQQTDAPFNEQNTLQALLLNHSGQPEGEVVQIATGLSPAVAADPAGGFVMAWLSPSFTLKARRFDAQGGARSPEIAVATAAAGAPSLAVLPDSRFVVAWTRHGTLPGVFRIFGSDGTPAGPETPFHAPTGRPDTGDPDVSADAAGRFVIAWSDADADQSHPFRVRLMVRPYGSDGLPRGPESVVAESLPGEPLNLRGVSARPEGSFLVLWTRHPDALRARAYNAAGFSLGDPIAVAQLTQHWNKAVAADVASSVEGWTVVWGDQDTRDFLGPWYRTLNLSSTCQDSSGSALCLNGKRFHAEVTWRVPSSGAEGTGTPIPLTGDTGGFWFFSPSNYELIVKVLDGQGVNGHFWVFYGSLTDVEFDLTVTDTQTGQQRTYHNPAGTMASRADTEAF